MLLIIYFDFDVNRKKKLHLIMGGSFSVLFISSFMRQ